MNNTLMKSIQQLFLLGCAAAVLTGCSSAPSRFYTLNATAQGDGKSEAHYAVLVGPVSIPAEVDRPQFTVQVAPNHVDVDEFNRWAAPLNENIARVVAENLAMLLGTPRVATAPLVNFSPDYRVTLGVQKFESVPGKSAQIDVVWVVRKMTGDVSLSGRTVAVESVNGDFDALAAAHSRALARVSQDIAAAIRSDAGAK